MKIEELEDKRLKIINGMGDKREQDDWEEKLEEVINGFRGKDSFTERELVELIGRVEVYSEGEIKVRWRFMDFTVRAVQYWLKVDELAS